MLNIGFCPPSATTRYDIKSAGLWYLRIRDRDGNDIGWLIIGRRGLDSGQLKGFLRWHHGTILRAEQMREHFGEGVEFYSERFFFLRTEEIWSLARVEALVSGR